MIINPRTHTIPNIMWSSNINSRIKRQTYNCGILLHQPAVYSVCFLPQIPSWNYIWYNGRQCSALGDRTDHQQHETQTPAHTSEIYPPAAAAYTRRHNNSLTASSTRFTALFLIHNVIENSHNVTITHKKLDCHSIWFVPYWQCSVTHTQIYFSLLPKHKQFKERN